MALWLHFTSVSRDASRPGDASRFLALAWALSNTASMGLFAWLLGRRGASPEPSYESAVDQSAGESEGAVVLPIDGTLDLHHFRPQDLRTLVPDYLVECQARGILQVRIVHGKGRGQLRRSVHALLERNPSVAGYGLAPPERGGWGATLVELLPGTAATPASDSLAE